MQDCARILHARLTWHVHPFLARFLHDSCIILHISCKKWCKILQELLPAFLAHFLQELVQDCARIMQEKGHIVCTCQASLACKILASTFLLSYLSGTSIVYRNNGGNGVQRTETLTSLFSLSLLLLSIMLPGLVQPAHMLVCASLYTCNNLANSCVCPHD